MKKLILCFSILFLFFSFNRSSYSETIDLIPENFNLMYWHTDAYGVRTDLDPSGVVTFGDNRISISVQGAPENEEKVVQIGPRVNINSSEDFTAKLSFENLSSIGEAAGGFQFALYGLGNQVYIIRKLMSDNHAWIEPYPFPPPTGNEYDADLTDGTFVIKKEGNDITLYIEGIDEATWSYPNIDIGDNDNVFFGIVVAPAANRELSVEITGLAIERHHPSPSYHIGLRWVQHRVYEDGRVLKYVGFQLLDESNNYVSEDIVDDVKLFDPEGYEVTIKNLEFWTYKLAFSHYDGWIGRWFYNPFQRLYEYKGEIDEDFKVGTYRFEVTDINGDVFEAYFEFRGVIDLPLISSRTIKTRFDRFGNFIARWAVPYYLNPELETSVRAMIMIYDDDEWIGAQYVLVPTHMGRLFVSSEVVDMTKAEGNRFELVIQLRTNNFDSRIYSNPRKLPLWSINRPPWRFKD